MAPDIFQLMVFLWAKSRAVIRKLVERFECVNSVKQLLLYIDLLVLSLIALIFNILFCSLISKFVKKII